MPTKNRPSNTEQMVSVPVSAQREINRDLDARQRVIWLRGGFDPIYCKEAQDSLKEIFALVAQPTSDGYSAGDMADQGAKAFRNGQRAMVLPDREMYTQYMPGITPSNATEVNSYKDGWNACLDKARRLNEASINVE